MAVLALGNFDGVHRGHQALIAIAKQRAIALGLPLIAVTFEPHPRLYFAPQSPPFRLTVLEQKRIFLYEAGADDLLILTFDAQLAAVSAEDFTRKLLIEKYQAKLVVAGQDFRFGHDRYGDMQRMAEWASQSRVEVLAVPAVRDEQGQRYAATTVRALLQNGQTAAAAAILGRPYIIRGAIAHGDRRGREMGFPTANINLEEYLRPQYGVYAVQIRRVGEKDWLSGVANIGFRPTLDGRREWLEVHIFDFSAEIYGEVWEVAFRDFIRPEMKFRDIAELKTQIADDIVAARKLSC